MRSYSLKRWQMVECVLACRVMLPCRSLLRLCTVQLKWYRLLPSSVLVGGEMVALIGSVCVCDGLAIRCCWVIDILAA